MGGKRRLQMKRGRARHPKDIVLNGQERYPSTGKGKRQRVSFLVPHEDKANTQYRVQQYTRDLKAFPDDIVATDCGKAVMGIPNRKQICCNHSKFFVEPKSRYLGHTLNHINGIEGSHFSLQYKAKYRRGGNRVRNKKELVRFLDEFDFCANFTNGLPEDKFLTVLTMCQNLYAPSS
jgi:hypothetical protein